MDDRWFLIEVLATIEDSSIMNIGIFVILGLILFFVVIPVILIRADRMSKKFGPQKLIGGNPCAQGELYWHSNKAPTIGGKMRFPYTMTLHRLGSSLTGKYQYNGNSKNPRRSIYSGEIYLSYRNGKILGRCYSGNNTKVIEGNLCPTGGDFLLGFPKGSFLPQSPFRYSLVAREVRLMQTKGSHGYLDPKSKLFLENNPISGNTISGKLDDFREFGSLEIKVKFEETSPELIVLAILLMGNDILQFHYD